MFFNEGFWVLEFIRVFVVVFNVYVVLYFVFCVVVSNNEFGFDGIDFFSGMFFYGGGYGVIFIL